MNGLSSETYNRLKKFITTPKYKQLSPETQQRLNKLLSSQGTIGITPSPFRQAIAETKRKGAAVTKGLLGDMPYARRLLPQQIQQFQPSTFEEKALLNVSRLGRDIGLMGGIGKLGLGRTALRGAGIGMATAGTEKPEEILGAGARGAAVLPLIKKADEIIVPFVSKIVQKGLKTSQQAWQDLIRAGFTVEKSTVERVQQKGINAVFSKKTGFRDKNAFLKLGNQIFDNTMKLRRYWGDKVGRWRNFLFKDPRIKVSIVNARNIFQNELRQPTTGLLAQTGEALRPTQGIGVDTAQNRLLEINNFLSSGDQVTPQVAYQIIDKLDDLVSASKRGVFSLAKNEGRIVANLRRDLIEQIARSAPRNISKGLRATETKFAQVAEITDDIFDKLPLRREGVAQTERIGATERNLIKGLKTDTPIEERQIWEKLNDILPNNEKFMELYKDIFAAQDLQREGIGWLMRRLFLSPRMAAFGLQATQPLMRGTGQVIGATGQAIRRLAPPIIMRQSIQGRR